MSKELPPEVAEFDKELYNLFDSRAVSASKIDKLTKLAFKAAKVREALPTYPCFEPIISPQYPVTNRSIFFIFFFLFRIVLQKHCLLPGKVHHPLCARVQVDGPVRARLYLQDLPVRQDQIVEFVGLVLGG